MRRNLPSSFGAVAAVLVAALAAMEVTPPRRAIVTGGIIPCQALPVPGSPRYEAGIVTVLNGDIVWVPGAGPASLVETLPQTVVATESVPLDGQYRFSLEPGRYVLSAQGPVGRYAQVTVGAGDDVHVDIPNVCI